MTDWHSIPRKSLANSQTKSRWTRTRPRDYCSLLRAAEAPLTIRWHRPRVVIRDFRADLITHTERSREIRQSLTTTRRSTRCLMILWAMTVMTRNSGPLQLTQHQTQPSVTMNTPTITASLHYFCPKNTVGWFHRGCLRANRSIRPTISNERTYCSIKRDSIALI